jgi:hypothetical protein
MIVPSSIPDHFIRSFPADRLITLLTKALMKWVIGSQPRVIDIEDDMHETIGLGVVILKKVSPPQTFDAKLNYPVYLAEPLVVVSLSDLFEAMPSTRRSTLIGDEFADASNTASRGYIMEDLCVLVLMKQFGGKYTRLGDVFLFKDSAANLASRKVSLVALRRTNDDEMFGCHSSFHTGASDRYGYKASSPANVVDFLYNPKGRPCLLPDKQMGPDVIAFLRDEESEELLLLLLQSKATPKLDPGTWLSAINSTLPDFFYTVVVRLNLLGGSSGLNISIHSRRDRGRSMLQRNTQAWLMR